MRILILIGSISIGCFATIFPIYSYSSANGSMFGAFIQQTLDPTNDTGLMLMGITQKKGPTGILTIRNMPIHNAALNIQLFGSSAGYSIGTEDTHIDAHIFTSIMTVEYPLNMSLDGIFGIIYSYYDEPNSNQYPSFSEMGAILGLEQDTRNKELNTTTGNYHLIKLTQLRQYNQVETDHRWFRNWQNGTVATRLYSAQTTAKSNHINYSQTAGNYFYLRGVGSSELIEKHLSLAQVEWRRPILFNFQVVPFIEYGGLGNTITSISAWLFSYGCALHIPLGEASMRIETARSSTNTEFYFGFNHVF